MKQVLTLAFLACAATSPVRAQPAPVEAVGIVLLERDTADPGPRGSPLARRVPDDDARQAQVRQFVDNEAARFALQLVARAWRVAGHEGALPALPVMLARGGNNAAVGYRLHTATGIEAHEREAYIVLDVQPQRFRLTLLHEAGHVAHEIVRRGARGQAPWSAVPHSTFAVTDPVTALSEGYAIQLETLWAHFGADSTQRAFYHRTQPPFDAPGTAAPYFFPASDLLNFSQTWSRYASVRDGLAAFSGHLYPGDYLRAQYDPARDLSTLRRPNALLASEGTVAAALFWTVSTLALQANARPGYGLQQPALLESAAALLRGMATSAAIEDRFRPDALDVIAALPDSTARRIAVTRWIDITRGVTARPELRNAWSAFYTAALHLDLEGSMTQLRALEPVRAEVLARALIDPATLRHGLGPVLPVRAPEVLLQLRALGEAFPLEFDLNATHDAELAALPRVSEAQRARWLAELDRAPFASIADFERRLEATLSSIGLERAL